ncbi:tryptophan synthase subunit alpha [Nonlabens spongiae]|uniref:Tryptophan synthase alpha chain n=1 Tax=Nonlabens spongiae TaxID=331648 RepID=A0A1W6MKE3_9FLAO|nr:tryptophan synthase subunit alpha [Nonlabens spongiae]ARN78071.1 tryptophan synthase subunit alpha [Nonlabens spongiae]
MKNKLTKLFERKDRNLLNIFFTAGYPELEDTPVILKSLYDAGADLVEIGIPFSDPLADGPTIQESSKQALENGMSIQKLFDQLNQFRIQNSEFRIPILLMGYFNPIMQYGLEKFCKRCSEVGVDGLIIPDLPLEIYISHYQAVFKKYNLSNIFLVTPQTSTERILQIDEQSTGFIYAVSSASTTGSKSDFGSASLYLERLASLGLKTPILTGFNIKTAEDFQQACQYVNGAIIGSAFIKALQDDGKVESKTNQFVKSILS